ncbi:MAG: HDOD domain-containing protein [Ruminococcaceae bacterium]|nr:HDOD domain-containing protein [Oscillospiraceae bacterium]
MNSYFAKQPILDLDGETYGYELLYRKGSDATSYDGIDGDKSTAGVINSVFFGEGYNKILNGKMAFLNFTENLLMEKAALLLPKDQVVIEILESVIASNEILDCCAELIENGYIIALDDYIYSYQTAPLLDYCDIVKIDFRVDKSDIEYTASRCREAGKIMLAEKIETLEEAEYAKSLGCTLMQGYYFAQPFIMVGKTYSPMAVTFSRLIMALRKDVPDVDELAEIISHDPFMTAKLIQLVNALRSDMSSHIYSVKQALVMLGMKKLKEWIYLLGLQNLAQGGPEERVKTALFRAFFCSSVSNIICKDTKVADEMYLMGLMSVLVVLHDADTMNEMGLSQSIKEGLIERKGMFGDVFTLMLDYEQGNWSGIDKFVEKYNANVVQMFREYMNCIGRVDEIIDLIA